MLRTVVAFVFVPGFLCPGIRAAGPQPVVAEKVRDRFVPAAYDSQKVEGFLGDRMRVNLEGRLLHVDEAALIQDFQHRPGKHPWVGEHAGKFLHAACNTWMYMHDERLKVLMDRMARELIATQLPDGYLGTYTDDQRWTSWDVWVHKYDLIGLLSYYQTTGYQPAMDAARKIGDLLCRTFGDQPGHRDIIKSGTHMGMAATSVLEPMVQLYRLTGEKSYLDFCEYIIRAYDQPNGPKIIASLESTGSVFKTANKKAYEMMSNLVGLLELYRLTGNETFLKPAIIAWNDISTRRLFVTGTTSSRERFRDDYDLPGEDGDNVGEGCATVTWLQLGWELLRITGEQRYADELERTVYNQLLGAQDTENGNICYFTPLDGLKRPSARVCCCGSSEPRGISMIPQLIWGAKEQGIALMLYAPGRVTLRGITIRSDTRFPQDGSVTLTIEPVKKSRFPLFLRVPRWTSQYVATVHGKKYTGKPGTFLEIDRAWRKGDQVAIRMDLTIQVLPGGMTYPHSVAIQRGPQVLALERALNPDIPLDHVAPATMDPKQVRLQATSDQFLNWTGNQLYTTDGLVEVSQKVKEKRLLLVPFSDAREMRVWLLRPDMISTVTKQAARRN